ncbi:putative reactive intermediate deaminase TdcF [Clostridiales bacterium]|nr:putative reactive intermediate deaminase TdcF [Clostridiales bacterium]
MEREIVKTTKAPKPLAPYSHAIKYGDLIFLSGQLSADIETGEIIIQDIAGQTKTAMDTIKSILEDAGSSMDKILKCTIHMTDEKLFEDMNKVYASYFTNGYPTRITTFGAKLYAGIDIEIEVIAGI